jgi:RNA polymerase sigma-70 factor, ECF subfamily
MHHSGVEARTRELCERKSYAEAAACLVEAYGPEILGFLRYRLRNELDASEAFSQFCEDAWLGIARFEWRCTARAWCYTLARNARCRLIRSPHHEAQRASVCESLASTVAATERSRTAPHLITRNKLRIRELRARLSEEDRLILAMHVDSALDWSALAQVTLSGPDRTSRALLREAARLRKRFQLIKGMLRRWAESEGLLDDVNESMTQ